MFSTLYIASSSGVIYEMKIFSLFFTLGNSSPPRELTYISQMKKKYHYKKMILGQAIVSAYCMQIIFCTFTIVTGDFCFMKKLYGTIF